jgi:hypothetical protein
MDTDRAARAVVDLLGAPLGTVHSQHHHAMRGLRAALDPDARSVVREVP